jgi:tetratricopeptide (TPR) repeat protein
MRLTTFHRAALLIVAAAIAVAALWWKCRLDPTISFLPADSRAAWIVFPVPVQAGAHRIATLDAVFRRQFQLNNLPVSAQLRFKAARRLELKINGRSIDAGTPNNWKSIAAVDVLGFLQNGANTIEARVFNDDGPPGLWLQLSAGNFQLRSDADWDASIAGSAWRRAVLATSLKHPGPGNLLAGGEKVIDAGARVWPVWLAFAAVAIVLVLATARLELLPPQASRWRTLILVGIAGAMWMVLFWHNGSLLPFITGYDANDHAGYIKYIQERRSLPLPNEGYEMFQPPFYYILSATALSILNLSISDHTAVYVLRALTAAVGIAHFAIVFLSLRLLFPARPGAQLIGLVLAAFLPMQIYLSHYLTNETLAALLATISIYLTLRILKKQTARVLEYAGLGLGLGVAMLTKATNLLLLLPILGAIILRIVRDRIALRSAVQSVGVTLTTFLITCGWYYVWIWRHFGKPIVGNWERVLGFNWWQDPGFHTVSQYFRFGRALIDPLFSGYNSFADGIYSTSWGDGLGGGLSDMLSRTPWNYDLMVAGYWLAMIPTLLIAIGVAVAIFRFVRQSSPEWFLLIGFSAAVALALVFMTLRVAAYAQVKAFYGLSALVPLCAYAAVGWDKVGQIFRMLRLALASLFLIWALNSFFSFWIRDSAVQHIYAGRRLIREHRLDTALTEAAQAARQEPSSATAQCFLASILDEASQTSKAIEHTNNGLQLDATNGYCQFQNAINLAKQGDIRQAMAISQRIVDSEAENARAYNLWFTCARQLQQTHEAIAIVQDALALSPFDADLHYRFGLVAGELGDFATAAPQFAYALLLQPSISEFENKLHLALIFAARSESAPQQLAAIISSAPESPTLFNEVAWILATASDTAVRNGSEAVRLSERACVLTKYTRPRFLITLAAAYAEAGRFPDAIATAREAALVGRANGAAEVSDLSEDLLTRFRANQPYRQELR